MKYMPLIIIAAAPITAFIYCCRQRYKLLFPNGLRGSTCHCHKKIAGL